MVDSRVAHWLKAGTEVIRSVHYPSDRSIRLCVWFRRVDDGIEKDLSSAFGVGALHCHLRIPRGLIGVVRSVGDERHIGRYITDTLLAQWTGDVNLSPESLPSRHTDLRWANALCAFFSCFHVAILPHTSFRLFVSFFKIEHSRLRSAASRVHHARHVNQMAVITRHVEIPHE